MNKNKKKLKAITMITTEKYIGFETAVLLKKLGFCWPSMKYEKETEIDGVKLPHLISIGNAKPPFINTCYDAQGKGITPKYYNANNPHFPRPTLAMACDWVEENFGVFIHVDVTYESSFIIFSGVARDLKTKETLWKTYGTNKNLSNKHTIIEQVLYNLLCQIILLSGENKSK